MSRLLIAIAAVLLIGAALTGKSEAQGSWTCDWSFANGVPSGWVNTNGTVTGSGLKAGAVSANEAYALLEYTAGGTTFTSMSSTFSGSAVGGPRYIATGPVSNAASTWNSSGSTTISWSGSTSAVRVYIGDYTTGAANANMWIVSMSLAGTGSAPGGCVNATPTPAATNTPAPPTATPLPTSTGVPYPTAGAFAASANDSYWGNTYNMAYGLQGWFVISGAWSGGKVMSATVGGVQRLEMEYPLGNVRLTDFFANYESSCPTTFEVKDGNTVFESGSVGSGMQAIVWQGEHVVMNGSVRLSLVGNASCGVSAIQLTEITIMGYGANPTNLQATAVAFNTGNIWSGLQDANTLLNSVPQSFAASVPNETGRAIFGYVKWLVSPSSADEIAGPFAPVISHIGFALLVMFAGAAIYALVWAVVWLLKFVIWLFQWLLKIVDLVLQIAQVVANGIGGLIKIVTGG